jgi:hypothetical protein
LLEEILCQLQLGLVEPQVSAIASEEAVASSSPDQEADIVAHDGTDDGEDDDQADGQAMGGPGIDGRCQERGLARHRDASALDPLYVECGNRDNG